MGFNKYWQSMWLWSWCRQGTVNSQGNDPECYHCASWYIEIQTSYIIVLTSSAVAYIKKIIVKKKHTLSDIWTHKDTAPTLCCGSLTLQGAYLPLVVQQLNSLHDRSVALSRSLEQHVQKAKVGDPTVSLSSPDRNQVNPTCGCSRCCLQICSLLGRSLQPHLRPPSSHTAFIRSHTQIQSARGGKTDIRKKFQQVSHSDT